MNRETNEEARLGEYLVRRVMTMVAVLHSRGIESLYLCSGMSGSGAGWRYSIGAMDAGHWPRPLRDPLQVFNSLNGSDESSQIEWGSICDDPTVLADKFVTRYGASAEAASVPNPAYAAWYRHMLTVSEPRGMLVYYFDYKSDPRPEFWGGEPEGYLDLPPGLTLG